MTLVRTEAVRQIALLQSQGYTHAEIAQRLGVSRSTVRNYVYDPDGSKARARKESYGQPCERCGRRTNGSNGRARAAKICGHCSTEKLHEERYWNPARVIAAIQFFHRQHGRPPFSTEWLYAANRDPLEEADDYDYPYTPVVLREFGTWLNAIKAAGLEPPDYHSKRKPDEYFFARILDLSEDGMAPPYRLVQAAIQALKNRGYAWHGVLRKLGLEPRRPKPPTAEELLDQLRELLVDGRMPLRKAHEALGSKLYKRGITWTEAADLIGATPNQRKLRQ